MHGALTSRSGVRYHCCSKPWRRLSEKSARKLQRPSSSLRSRDALSRGYSIPPCSASPQPQRSALSKAQAQAFPGPMVPASPELWVAGLKGPRRRARGGARSHVPRLKPRPPHSPFWYKTDSRPRGTRRGWRRWKTASGEPQGAFEGKGPSSLRIPRAKVPDSAPAPPALGGSLPAPRRTFHDWPVQDRRPEREPGKWPNSQPPHPSPGPRFLKEASVRRLHLLMPAGHPVSPGKVFIMPSGVPSTVTLFPRTGPYP